MIQWAQPSFRNCKGWPLTLHSRLVLNFAYVLTVWLGKRGTVVLLKLMLISSGKHQTEATEMYSWVQNVESKAHHFLGSTCQVTSCFHRRHLILRQVRVGGWYEPEPRLMCNAIVKKKEKSVCGLLRMTKRELALIFFKTLWSLLVKERLPKWICNICIYQ